MDSEEEIFGLMRAAKDQQAAVERALAELARERKAIAQQNAAFFEGASRLISDFRSLKDQLAREAVTGIQTAVAGIGADLTKPIKNEVQTTVITLTAVREDIEKGARWLSWRWIVGCMVMAFVLGYAASWAMYQRSLESLSDQISVIQQNTPQPQLHSQPPNSTRRGHGADVSRNTHRQ